VLLEFGADALAVDQVPHTLSLSLVFHSLNQPACVCTTPGFIHRATSRLLCVSVAGHRWYVATCRRAVTRPRCSFLVVLVHGPLECVGVTFFFFFFFFFSSSGGRTPLYYAARVGCLDSCAALCDIRSNKSMSTLFILC
jgi:hypothetical protein